MKRSAPAVGLQWNLPLVEMAALETPEQQQLALALLELLLQAARQPIATNGLGEGGKDASEVNG